MLAPEGMDTRPTTDRIKETLFNIIQDENTRAYFLICCSGQMGLRQSAEARAMRCLSTLAKSRQPASRGISGFTKFEHQTKLYPTEVLSALSAMEGKYRFDLIFMDPPYLKRGMSRRFTVSYFPF